MQAFREMLKAEAKGDTYSLPPRDQLLGAAAHGPPAAALNKVYLMRTSSILVLLGLSALLLRLLVGLHGHSGAIHEQSAVQLVYRQHAALCMPRLEHVRYVAFAHRTFQCLKGTRVHLYAQTQC